MRVAYHEAGHAIVAAVLDVEIDVATAGPKAGRVAYILPPHLSDAERIMMAMAGDVAELIQYKRRDLSFGTLQDERVWRSFIADLPDEEQHRYLAHCRKETRRILKAHWRAVEHVARVLADVGTMPGAEIKRIVGG